MAMDEYGGDVSVNGVPTGVNDEAEAVTVISANGSAGSAAAAAAVVVGVLEGVSVAVVWDVDVGEAVGSFK